MDTLITLCLTQMLLKSLVLGDDLSVSLYCNVFKGVDPLQLLNLIATVSPTVKSVG